MLYNTRSAQVLRARLPASSSPPKFGRQHLALIRLRDPELSRYAGRRDSGLEGCARRIHLTLCQRDVGLVWLPPFGRSFRCDGSDARSPAPIWVAGRISGALVVSLPRRCGSCRVAASSLSSSRSSNCLECVGKVPLGAHDPQRTVGRMSGVPECDKALVRLLPRIGPPSVAECDSMACRPSFQIQAYPFRLTPANLARHRTNPHLAFWKMLKIVTSRRRISNPKWMCVIASMYSMRNLPRIRRILLCSIPPASAPPLS
jgi:hypothetical protein